LYLCLLIVRLDDSRIPLGGAIHPVDLHPVAHEHARRLDEYTLPVLGLKPLTGQTHGRGVVAQNTHVINVRLLKVYIYLGYSYMVKVNSLKIRHIE